MLVMDLLLLALMTLVTKRVHGEELRGGVRGKRLRDFPRIGRMSMRYYKRRRIYRGSDLLTTIDGRVRCCSSRRLSRFVNQTPRACARRRVRVFHSMFCAVRRASMTN